MTWPYLKLLVEFLSISWRLYPRATAALVSVKVVAVGTTPAMALALRDAVNAIIGGHPGAAVLGAAGAAVAFAAHLYLGGLDRVLQMMLADRFGAVHLRRLIEQNLARLPGLDHLERTDLLDRITALQGAGWGLSHTPWQAISAVCHTVKLGLLLLLLGAVTPWLVLLLLFAAAPLWFDHRGQRTVGQAEIATAEAYRLQRHLFALATGPAGGKEIRVSGAGPEIARRQEQAWAEAMRGRYRARVHAMAWNLTGWTLFTVGFGASLALVVARAAGGDNSVGDLVLAITIAVTLRDAVQDTLLGVAGATGGRPIVEPLLWLRRYTAANHHTGHRRTPPALHEGITFERVTFTYPDTARPAVEQISCHLPAGSVVAVVGEYGSGKTTLVKLLSKFYLPDTGRILVDGVDLADLDTIDWRSRSGAAFQDFGRFRIRLGDCVGIGDLPDLHDDERVMGAVRAADAEPLVQRLPDGLDTQLGGTFDGAELSEGQWQKTALARACMRERPLLFVLDEPTASLDAPSEHAIFQRHTARARDLARRTGAITVIISHRFSTVTSADHILVMHQGRLVEHGTHEHLIDAGGRYADLYGLQAAAYAGTGPDS